MNTARWLAGSSGGSASVGGAATAGDECGALHAVLLLQRRRGPRRLDDHDREHQHERDLRLVRAAAVAGDERLRDAEQQPAGERDRRPGQPAEDRGGEAVDDQRRRRCRT